MKGIAYSIKGAEYRRYSDRILNLLLDLVITLRRKYYSFCRKLGWLSRQLFLITSNRPFFVINSESFRFYLLTLRLSSVLFFPLR